MTLESNHVGISELGGLKHERVGSIPVDSSTGWNGHHYAIPTVCSIPTQHYFLEGVHNNLKENFGQGIKSSLCRKTRASPLP
mmetsp:Transcript_33686/g.64186  ORF Transcript_33686/g.64186 Transcript_33686/m.64186 type:complete len:82 (+) Transcript_33686:1456-1701(+)